MCFSPQRRAFFRHQNFKKCSKHVMFCNIFTSKCAFRHSGVQFFRHQNFKKWSKHVMFCNIFTSECAFRHSGVQFFRHLNFKKCSRTVSFLTFSLPNVLFATAACNFWFPKMCFSVLTTWLRTRRFNRPTFRLTRHTNHWKNTAFRDFSNIWRGCIFFLLTFALLHLLSADLTTLLCFSTVHIVGSFYLNFLQGNDHISPQKWHFESMIFRTSQGGICYFPGG